MTTLTKYIVGLILSLLFFSCQFNMDFGVNGNGNVETIEREIDGEFNEIEVSRGLDVYLTQDNVVSLAVEADENLHDIIVTKVEGNVLKIYADENISYSKAKMVHLSFPHLKRIEATSGSDVIGKNTFEVDNLVIETTSGSDLELDVDANEVRCSSTSGSDLRLSGSTDKLYATATSGSDIKARNLEANTCDAKATSGADITVNTSDALIAKASSGGDIKFYGNPNKIETTDNVSGSVRKQ